MELLFAITKFGTNVKDKIKKEHHYNLSYSVKCPMKNCPESNNGETARRLIERGTEHSGKDIKSNMLRYSIEVNHPTVTFISQFLAVVTGAGSLRGKYQIH